MIGLSWEPKLPGLTPSSSASTAAASGSKNVSAEAEISGLWRSNSELVDGLFIPPNNPRKLNKLLRKQVKDTAGSSWYVYPVFSCDVMLFHRHQVESIRSYKPAAIILSGFWGDFSFKVC